MDDVIKVSGLREVNVALYSYSQQLGDKVALAALRQGANLIRRTVQSLVPVKTGRLRKGFRISRSKIHRGKMSGDMIGVYLTLKKGKDAPFYGRFQNDGWNTAGERRTLANTPGKVNRRGNLMLSRSAITAHFGRKTGRTTLPGKTNVKGLHFIQRAFADQRVRAAQLIIQSAEAGAAVLAKKTGL